MKDSWKQAWTVQEHQTNQQKLDLFVNSEYKVASKLFKHPILHYATCALFVFLYLSHSIKDPQDLFPLFVLLKIC